MSEGDESGKGFLGRKYREKGEKVGEKSWDNRPVLGDEGVLLPKTMRKANIGEAHRQKRQKHLEYSNVS